MDIITKLNENLIKFFNHICTFKHQLSKIEGKSVQSELKLLTSVKSIHYRYKNLKHLDLFSFCLKKTHRFELPPQYSSLDKITKPFPGGLILDLETTHPQLIIFEDRKIMQYGKTEQNLCYNPNSFSSTLVF